MTSTYCQIRQRLDQGFTSSRQPVVVLICFFLNMMDGMGLLFLATSYENRLVIQFLSTPEMLPDVDFFNDCLQAGCDEMLAMTR